MRRERESTWCVDCGGSEYGRRSCGKPAHEWLARSLARQVCAKSRGRSGQRASSSSSNNEQNPLQLPTGHAVLETSVSSTRQSCIAAPSATASLIAVALYRWKHVTSMLGKGSLFSCTFSLLPSSPVSILLPAPPVSMSHMAQRGVKKSSVNLCLLWCCLHATIFLKNCPLQ